MNMNTSAVCDSETFEKRMAALEERMAALESGKLKEKKVPVPKAKKETSAPLALSPSDDMGRMSQSDINDELCQARRLPDETLPGYAPKVYREAQCTKPKKEGDLCTICSKAFEKATELGDEFQCHKAGHPKWWGLITEDPHPTCHMLGTAWAEKKVTKVDADGAASDSGSSEQMTKAEKAQAVKAEKAAAAAVKKATASVAKAEKAAAKEAEKAAKAAAKKPKKAKAAEAEAEEPEAEPEVEVAEAEEPEVVAAKPTAEKVKAKAEPKAKAEKPKAEKVKAEPKVKAEKAKGKKKAETPDVMPAKAADEEVKETYEVFCWDDVLLLKKTNGDCYYSEDDAGEVPVKYAGHVTDDGMLDKDIPEQKEAESDSE